MTTRYPTTTRVTAGRLAPGDEILVRSRRSDGLPLRQAPDAVGMECLQPGTYRVEATRKYYAERWTRAVAYYLVDVVSVGGLVGYTLDLSAVQRVNRIET